VINDLKKDSNKQMSEVNKSFQNLYEKFSNLDKKQSTKRDSKTLHTHPHRKSRNEMLNNYLATKKNEMLSFTSKWMELENIILSKVSQAQKTKNRMLSLICGL
jgi:DNA polymerase I-like protein with 3'-5' exonuclease and polymerase domains